MENQINADLSKQILKYEKAFNIYKNYASMLEKYFKNACRDAIPQAIIQTRPKTLSSFAEKAIRKAKEYPDPINQFGDLCGARIIVHTKEQVNWVNEFIDSNFEVVEKEDVQKRLGENQFGYLSVHFIVMINPKHDYGIPKKLIRQMAGRKAEVQVKTILQHAWSDILHDRTYKNKIELPEDIKRNSAILAALMEEGDEKFAKIVERTDNYFLNFSAYMTRKEIDAEIRTLAQILQFEPDKESKPATALKLARLIALSSQDHQKVIDYLEPYKDIQVKARPYILLELGFANCKLHRHNPKTEKYKKGQNLFEIVLNECSLNNCFGVVDKNQIAGLKALAHARLAWSNEVFVDRRNKTSAQYFEALKSEPCNPYYLAESLAYKRALLNTNTIPDEMHILIMDAIDTCTSHARAGMELPQAHFTRGRLYLLMRHFETAYGFYALGIRHFLDKEHFSPDDMLEREEAWLNLLACPDDDENIDHIRRLILLGKAVFGDEESKNELFKTSSGREIPDIEGNILIVAGGASEMHNNDLPSAENIIYTALHDFEGTIISGGTTAGIPDLVGKVVKRLKTAGRNINLIGYLPAKLPTKVNENKDYDKTIQCKGTDFSADQLHQSWIDILRTDTDPKCVKLIGINGGKISAMEYRLAAALGATTGIIKQTGREAEELESDTDWLNVPNMMFVPSDSASINLFVSQYKFPFDRSKLEALGKLVHEKYFDERIKNNPDESLKYWDDLQDNLKESNRQQVECSVYNLKKAGFGVRKVDNPNARNVRLLKKEIELLAELEHGRWNAERLLDGWRYGPVKNIKEKTNPSLISWSQLPDSTKKWDRIAVKEFPFLLVKAGLEIFRMKDQEKIFAKTKKMLAMKFEFSKEKPKK